MQLDLRLRFDNFVVGSANRLASAAAHAVADAPGSVYTPLFIYSASGLGKTHLMCAIGNQVRQRTPEAVIEHVTLDDVVGQMHAAIAAGQTDALRRRFQDVTVLLIDDMQFLTGHLETQSELLRVLNALHASGRQIVMTSDRPPAELAGVDERLLTRLSGGLIVDIGPPDYETRMAIMRAKCEERGVAFRPGVIEELARLEFRNVRELQGALNRLIAVQTLGGEQILPADVIAVLGDLADSLALTNPPPRQSSGYATFLSGVASAVAEHVERWPPPLPGPSSLFTRAVFEVGTSNQLAVRAADVVVEHPGVRYNPLFFHGPSGVGKTHLVHAIGNGLLASRRDARVAVLSAQTFIDELIGALQEGAVERWRAVYRSADALLIDDIQSVVNKERTQEELFHVFNALYADGKQLVFASDQPPRELSGLEDRLRSRFEGGLVVDLQAPDRALCEKLYARFLRAAGTEPAADLLEYLADRSAASVRDVIGTVNRVVAAAEVAKAPVTLSFVRAQLEPAAPDRGDLRRRPIPTRDVVDDYFLNEEKVVWTMVDVAGRLIEDGR